MSWQIPENTKKSFVKIVIGPYRNSPNLEFRKNYDPMEQAFRSNRFKNYFRKFLQQNLLTMLMLWWENNLEDIPISKLIWQETTDWCQMDKKLNKMLWKKWTKMGMGWVGGRVKASKKNSTWLWLIKIFYNFFLEKIWKHLKNMQIVWKSCIANSVCKSHSDVCQGK